MGDRLICSTSKRWVEQGGAGGAQKLLHSTPPPWNGVGGGASVHAAKIKVEQKPGGALVRTYAGQVYTSGELIPYTRRDGTETMLQTWHSHCAECGRLFSCKMSAYSAKFEPNRRCQEHKRPGLKLARVLERGESPILHHHARAPARPGQRIEMGDAK